MLLILQSLISALQKTRKSTLWFFHLVIFCLYKHKWISSHYLSKWNLSKLVYLQQVWYGVTDRGINRCTVKSSPPHNKILKPLMLIRNDGILQRVSCLLELSFSSSPINFTECKVNVYWAYAHTPCILLTATICDYKLLNLTVMLPSEFMCSHPVNSINTWRYSIQAS